MIAKFVPRAATACMAASTLIHAPAHAGDGARPNIVYIMADDLGWRDVGYAGAKFFNTPHIDRLAKQSMVFNYAYSAGPNCAPTRACLMSGTYTPRHHIYQPGGSSKGRAQYMRLLVPARWRKDKALAEKAADQFPIATSLPADFVCIPEVLKPAGYRTARLGKWHLGADLQGFDVSTTDGRGSLKDNFYGDVDVAEQLTDRAVEFIEANREKPFFLYLSHWDVHTPHRARNPVVEKYQAKLDAIPPDQRENFNPVYAAMIEAVDTSVGRVVETVDKLGLTENTVIIFTSDNGGLPGVSQRAPLRSCKGSLFEGGIRVPFCVRWKGVTQPGSTCDVPISSVDMLPTFASLGNAQLPKGQPVDGTDFSPLLSGGQVQKRALFWHYPLYLEGPGHTIQLPNGKTYSWRGVPASAMRRGDFKLKEYFEDNSIALYNIREDPGEQHNLATTMPELAAKMRAELDAWQAVTKAPIPTTPNPECILPAL